MKNLILLLVILICLMGCFLKTPDHIKDENGKAYIMVSIEDCEYIKTPNTYGYALTHKGNCNNPIHRGRNE